MVEAIQAITVSVNINKSENEYLKDKIEKIEKKISNTTESKLARGLFWAAIILFTLAAGYWIIEILVTYSSEPVMAEVSIKKNKSFEWPSITIEPDYNCYNKDIVIVSKL